MFGKTIMETKFKQIMLLFDKTIPENPKDASLYNAVNK